MECTNLTAFPLASDGCIHFQPAVGSMVSSTSTLHQNSHVGTRHKIKACIVNSTKLPNVLCHNSSLVNTTEEKNKS